MATLDFQYIYDIINILKKGSDELVDFEEIKRTLNNYEKKLKSLGDSL